MRLPLAGIRVLEFGQLIATPCAGMILGELGAQVIKVEQLDGDPGRQLRSAGVPEDKSGVFSAYNRSKQSVALNLKTGAGRSIARRLAARSDVLLEGLRPGALDKLGLSFEELSEVNDGLIYASLSAFSSLGPQSMRGGVDLVVQAESGMMSLSGSREGPPTRVGISVVDVVSGNILVQAILAALIGRSASGGGQRIQLSLMDVALHLQSGPLTELLVGGAPVERSGNDVSYSAPAGMFKTRDGAIVLAAYRELHWSALCSIIDRADLVHDERFKTGDLRVTNREALNSEIETALASRSSVQWLEEMLAVGISCGIVRDHESVLGSPEIEGSRIIEEVGTDPSRREPAVHIPAIFNGQRPIAETPPRLGEHTIAVLAELGYSAEEIDVFVETGAVAGARTDIAGAK